jgi:hypothetical protein
MEIHHEYFVMIRPGFPPDLTGFDGDINPLASAIPESELAVHCRRA